MKMEKIHKKGRINNITNTISLNNELISKGNDAVLDTLIHEIQHRIQKIEKFTQGTTSAIGFENYQNNFGEKEARDTSNRRKMNYETRLKTPPISSLTANIIDKNKNKWYSLNEVEQDAQENNTISSQNVSENIYSRGKLGRNTKGQELENSSFSFDNKGRKLSKGQQEYFKDSKARDENGNLKVLYHGTPNDFTKFSYDKLGTNGTLLGKGFYLTDDINVAKAYASKGEKGKVMELYADIKKPLKWGEKSISKQQYKSFVESINEITMVRCLLITVVNIVKKEAHNIILH